MKVSIKILLIVKRYLAINKVLKKNINLNQLRKINQISSVKILKLILATNQTCNLINNNNYLLDYNL
jgi:hypothetical protein